VFALSRRLTPTTGLIAALITAAAFCVAIQPAAATTPKPPSPAALRTIEPLAAYVPQDSCNPVVKPGTAALAALLRKTYARTVTNTTYACGTDGPVSEHYEGRAIDWMVPISNRTDKADANAVLSWLFATDTAGNTYSNARRLGLMYIVFDNRIWGSWDHAWQPYDNCANEPGHAYDNSCHRTHMHLSLSWAGANKRTSFWSNTAVATDYGPCKSTTLNWAGQHSVARSTPCPPHSALLAPAKASALYRAVLPWSGARAVYGDRGPVVVAIQKVVKVSADGSFGSLTRTALRKWQTAHHLAATGTANQVTWHAIMAAV
jgi:peptidoglycan hydrolase-like protein with peptidoglycan-binding domain